MRIQVKNLEPFVTFLMKKLHRLITKHFCGQVLVRGVISHIVDLIRSGTFGVCTPPKPKVHFLSEPYLTPSHRQKNISLDKGYIVRMILHNHKSYMSPNDVSPVMLGDEEEKMPDKPVLNLDALSMHARTAYIEIGRQFGSEQTFQQANQTIKSLQDHRDALKPYGFIQKDEDKLELARTMLFNAGVGREGAKVVKKKLSQAQKDAFFEGRRQREKVRSVAEGIYDDVFETGGDEKLPLAREISTVLEQTSRAEDTPDKLAKQLKLFGTLFEKKELAPYLKERGQEDIVKETNDVCGVLNTVSKEYSLRPGTPEHTERLDLLDGLIVRLARRAQRAAVVASKVMGQESIANAFKLTQLYPTPAKQDKAPNNT